MTWLNALIAFALAMIVFCTMVSAITELIQHVLARRQQGLEWMLQRFYLDVLRPAVIGQPAPDDATLKEELGTFIPSLTKNLAARSQHGYFSRRAELTLDEFAERLPQTAIGQALWQRCETLGGAGTEAGQNELRRLWEYAAHQFERYERDATAYFAQRAQSLSLVVALALAFALNIDALRLFSTFLADQQLTARFLAQAETVTAPLRDVANAAPSATVSGDLNADLASLKEHLRATSTLGLPIGTQFFPFCVGDTLGDPACKITSPRARLAIWIKWLAATLLAGALIGLGGPFWFDAFSKLSQLMQVFRVPPTPDSTAATPAPGQAPSPDLMRTFIAAATRAAASAGGQGLLSLGVAPTPSQKPAPPEGSDT